MKQRIKDFFLKKIFFKEGIKILKRKKGFSLMEVLIAVAIIAIISGIAVPQYTAQRNNAAKVASDTSAGNIAKAFKHCIALNDFASCKTLSAIKVSCPAGSTCVSGGKDATGPGTISKFCAHLHRGKGGSDFKVCISVDGEGTETRSYAGGLLSTVGSGLRCHSKTTDSTTDPTNNCKGASAASPVAGLKSCESKDDCGDDEDATATDCGLEYSCTALSSMDAVCDKDTGNCS